MKKMIIIGIVLFTVHDSFGQFQKERAFRIGKWKPDKESFFSGDTLTFIFKNKRRSKLYCYTGADYYILYKIAGAKEMLIEDTTLRGMKEPVLLKRHEKIIVKKIITDPGSYAMRYDVFIEKERNQKTRVTMEQHFDIKAKD